MHQKHDKFIQNIPASTWEVNNIPENAVNSVVTHIETLDGEILQPDSQMRAPYGIQLSFGVREVAGTAYYEYYTEEIVINGSGSSMSVTINQYNNGGTASEPYNFPESASGED